MSYTAIVLNDDSHNKLVKLFGSYWVGKPGWKTFAHHTTMHMGPPTPEEEHLVGEYFSLLVTGFAKDDKVMAVSVELPEEVESKNATPHVTLAVNLSNGGKPFLSNKLTDWQSVDPLLLRGRFESVQ